jgi:HPt (histidine-containing phosphotransfer) domain-containing protein
MPDTPINLATFKELQDTAGAEFVLELVDTFCEEAPQMLKDMRSALAGGDADALRRAAHSLKSNSHTFGADKLGEMARALELGGFDAAKAAGTAAIDALQHEYARAAAALKRLRDA